MTRFHDTPFERQHIAQMTFTQITEWVALLRERRMQQQRMYEEVRAAKVKIKEERSLERYKKVLTMLNKRCEAADKALAAIDKYMAEASVLRIEFGDNPWQK